ncbi:MAG: hypothetical protein JKY15_02040 [Deltaproteobacteria bacterium]|nr:hypothetical protein [Deltaproteobacteria bacterium]
MSQALQPFSENWNTIKGEFRRNQDVFRELEKATQNKDTLKELGNLIAANIACIEVMERIEKNSNSFPITKPIQYKRNPPFVEPDEE